MLQRETTTATTTVTNNKKNNEDIDKEEATGRMSNLAAFAGNMQQNVAKPFRLNSRLACNKNAILIS